MSNGRLVVEAYGGGAIVPAHEETDGVHNGILELGSVWAANDVSKWPVACVFGSQMMGGLPPLKHYMWMLSEGEELMAEMYEPLDVTYVAIDQLHASELWVHSKVPIKSLADMKGLKMRALGDAAEVLGEMGVTTVFVAGVELYESAARGVIDAFEYGQAAVDWDMAFQEVTDYVYISPSRAPLGMNAILANESAWAELPPDLQAIVKSAARARAIVYYTEMQFGEAAVLEKFRDYGNTVEPLPKDVEEEFTRLAAEFYKEKTAQDPLYGKVVDSILEAKRSFELMGM